MKKKKVLSRDVLNIRNLLSSTKYNVLELNLISSEYCYKVIKALKHLIDLKFTDFDMIVFGKNKILIRSNKKGFIYVLSENSKLIIYFTFDMKNHISNILSFIESICDNPDVMFIKCSCRKNVIKICFENIPDKMYDRFKLLKFEKGCKEYTSSSVALQDIVNIVFIAKLYNIYTYSKVGFIHNISDASRFLDICRSQRS